MDKSKFIGKKAIILISGWFNGELLPT